MPIYTIELDGRHYDLEGDHPPTEAEARAAIGSTTAPETPRAATPPPASATIGMIAPSTKNSPARTGTLMDLIPDADARKQDMSAMVDALPAAVATPSPQAAVAGAKGVPGIIARRLGISRVRAGVNIEQALQAGMDAGVTVDASKAAEAGLRGIELKAAKYRMPQAASELVERMTNPTAAPLTPQGAHDLASNLSSLSVNEMNTIKPQMQRVVSQMAKESRQALVDALNGVGAGDQYASGVKEYRRAAVAGKVASNAAKAATVGATGYLGYGWLRKLLSEAAQ